MIPSKLRHEDGSSALWMANQTWSGKSTLCATFGSPAPYFVIIVASIICRAAFRGYPLCVPVFLQHHPVACINAVHTITSAYIYSSATQHPKIGFARLNNLIWCPCLDPSGLTISRFGAIKITKIFCRVCSLEHCAAAQRC